MIRILAFVSSLLILGPAPLAGQGGERPLPDTPAGQRATELLETLNGSPADRQAFLGESLSPELRRGRTDDEWVSQLQRLSRTLTDAKRVGVRMAGPDEITLAYRTADDENVRLSVRVADVPPHRILGLRVEAGGGPREAIQFASWAELDETLREQESEGRFSGVVLAARRDSIHFHRAYGRASRDRNRPVRLDTRFNVGSLIKPMTGVLVLRLAREGRVDLDDPVGRYVDDLRPEVGEEVTLMHLLRHRSGLGDYLGEPEFRENPDRFGTVADLMDLVREQELAFEPGTGRQYSNSGFVLLGAVVEAVTGRSYGPVLEDWVFEPAGMSRSSLERDSGEGAATPLRRTDDGDLQPVDHLHADRGSPAGGGYSTAGDLHAFARALLDDRLLEPECTNLLLAGYDRDVAREEGRFGVGWGGGAPGVNATLEIDPDGTVVAVVANRDPPAASRVGISIMRWLR